MNFPDKIKTISGYSEFRLKEKGSIFIGTAYPVSDEKIVNEILIEIKKKHFDATHNCYAFRLANGITKYSDDGEPRGTAGIRIFNVINHFNLFNILTVVTRYFGGTKLGIGLLGKTYYDTAYECLSNSEKVDKILYSKIIIKLPYESIYLVNKTLSKYKAIIDKNLFDEEVQIYCYIPTNIKKNFFLELTNYIKNQISIEDINTTIYL